MSENLDLSEKNEGFVGRKIGAGNSKHILGTRMGFGDVENIRNRSQNNLYVLRNVELKSGFSLFFLQHDL